MIIPLDIRHHGLFNGSKKLVINNIIVDLIECDVKGEEDVWGVDEAVLTNQTFLQGVMSDENLSEVLRAVYNSLLTTKERYNPKEMEI